MEEQDNVKRQKRKSFAYDRRSTWTKEQKNLFYHAVAKHGKDYNTIRRLIIESGLRNKVSSECVRCLFLRTFKRACEYLKYFIETEASRSDANESMKKFSNELKSFMNLSANQVKLVLIYGILENQHITCIKSKHLVGSQMYQFLQDPKFSFAINDTNPIQLTNHGAPPISEEAINVDKSNPILTETKNSLNSLQDKKTGMLSSEEDKVLLEENPQNIEHDEDIQPNISDIDRFVIKLLPYDTFSASILQLGGKKSQIKLEMSVLTNIKTLCLSLSRYWNVSNFGIQGIDFFHILQEKGQSVGTDGDFLSSDKSEPLKYNVSYLERCCKSYDNVFVLTKQGNSSDSDTLYYSFYPSMQRNINYMEKSDAITVTRCITKMFPLVAKTLLLERYSNLNGIQYTQNISAYPIDGTEKTTGNRKVKADKAKFKTPHTKVTKSKKVPQEITAKIKPIPPPIAQLSPPDFVTDQHLKTNQLEISKTVQMANFERLEPDLEKSLTNLFDLAPEYLRSPLRRGKRFSQSTPAPTPYSPKIMNVLPDTPSDEYSVDFTSYFSSLRQNLSRNPHETDENSSRKAFSDFLSMSNRLKTPSSSCKDFKICFPSESPTTASNNSFDRFITNIFYTGSAENSMNANKSPVNLPPVSNITITRVGDTNHSDLDENNNSNVKDRNIPIKNVTRNLFTKRDTS